MRSKMMIDISFPKLHIIFVVTLYSDEMRKRERDRENEKEKKIHMAKEKM